MELLDEEGRLFGRVNVVDALVVAVAIALLAGGLFVVVSETGGAPPESDPLRYATVSYEAALDSPAVGLSIDDELGPEGHQVTDVHRSTTANGTAHVTARVAYRVSLSGVEDVLAGEELTMTADDARVRATVLRIDQEEDSFDIVERSLVVRLMAGSAAAGAVEPGDEVTVGGEPVATIEAVEEREDETVIGVTVPARETSAGPSFGGRLLRAGEEVGLVTDRAKIRGHVLRLGTSDPTSAG